MKNVIIFALGAERHALELRWVREIFTLPALTPVPTAPAILDGVVNFRGAIVPVLSLRTLLGSAGRRAPMLGDALILVDVDGTRVALAVDRVDAVTSLDGSEADVSLIDPPALVAAARQQIEGGHGARA